MGREGPPTSLSIFAVAESECLRPPKLSWLAETRWPNVFRAALDKRRVWWEKTPSGVVGKIRPWRAPGNAPLVKSISRSAAVGAASVFKREDESTSSPRARRATGRGVSVGLSNARDRTFPGAGWPCSVYRLVSLIWESDEAWRPEQPPLQYLGWQQRQRVPR
jgi:hypothetical protein